MTMQNTDNMLFLKKYECFARYRMAYASRVDNFKGDKWNPKVLILGKNDFLNKK